MYKIPPPCIFGGGNKQSFYRLSDLYSAEDESTSPRSSLPLATRLFLPRRFMDEVPAHPYSNKTYIPVLFERAMVVSYRLSIVTIALRLSPFGRDLPSNVSDAQIIKSTGGLVTHFGANAKFGEEGIDRCMPNFNAIWERQGLSYAKKSCRYLLLFEHSART